MSKHILSKLSHTLLGLLCVCPLYTQAQRHTSLLQEGWKFHQGEANGAAAVTYADSGWTTVRIPHDWAIFGPFDRKNDLQTVAVVQNLESKPTDKTGRTGGLPYTGVGWYRRTFTATSGKQTTLVFDGAMSEARVYVNGHEAVFWPYGYNSFHTDVTPYLHTDGRPNQLAVRLENRPQSSRWYPGAGLYRQVHLIETEKLHIPVWGTRMTTPEADSRHARAVLRTELAGTEGQEVRLRTVIYNTDRKAVASDEHTFATATDTVAVQEFHIDRPQLWSPESPSLYRAVTEVYADGKLQDRYETPFGIRHTAFIPEKGFFLNGQPRKFQGVCLHHDLGALGAAVNESALRHQLRLLKDMGCDAIRTAHNMPAPELVRLCDEMGFMMVVEAFDEWDVAKCENGYHRYFEEWADRDLTQMIRQYRNHPSVILWSIGNEVPTQWSEKGKEVAAKLVSICHREDDTRPVTCGMDQVEAVIRNGFADALDIPGFNYRTHFYQEAHDSLRHGFVLGSETASTVSSRGVYHFPAERAKHPIRADHQNSSYDLDYCAWSNIPDFDFVLAEDHDWTLGQFVWTGFDYLGEPSPYDTDAWPNHSSMFGIIDLAAIPKDRYYLYRSHWNKKDPTLWVLPHWTWPGREGQVTPVFVYTSSPSAELFINGKSQGIRHKKNAAEAQIPEERYRLMWKEVRYEPGELKVVSYDKNQQKTGERIVRTAGKPHHIRIVHDADERFRANGEDVHYLTVQVVDKDGNLCPHFNGLLHFEVTGAAEYRAAANGDPTCLDLFHKPEMHAFNGQLTVILKAGKKAGKAQLTVRGDKLEDGRLKLRVGR